MPTTPTLDAAPIVDQPHSTVDLLTFCCHCAAIIRRHGYVSGPMALENPVLKPTTDVALVDLLHPHGHTIEPVTDADRQMAAEALAWAAALPNGSSPGWEQRVSQLTQSARLEMRHTGLAASMVGMYWRRIARPSAKTIAPRESQRLGKPGQRLHDLAVTLVAFQDFPSEYGTRRYYRMATPEGDLLTWSSRPMAWDVQDSATLTATVKDYSVYKGHTVTVLTNGKLSNIRKAPA